MNEVQIPAQLLNLILGLIATGTTWLVVAGIKGIGEAFGRDLSNTAKVVSAVVATGMVGIITNLLNLAALAIPLQYVDVVQSGLSFLVVLFSAIGVQRQYKKFK